MINMGKLLLYITRMLGSHPRQALARRFMLALTALCVALGGIAPAGLPLAAPPSAQAAAGETGDVPSPPVSPAGADGAAAEQPQSWLLKWRDPALADELRGTRIIRRQHETAVDLVAPADTGADIEAWLAELRTTPGVEYVHPNYSVRILASVEESITQSASMLTSTMGQITAQPASILTSVEESITQSASMLTSTMEQLTAQPASILASVEEPTTQSASMLTSVEKPASPATSMQSAKEKLAYDSPTLQQTVDAFKANDPELSKQAYLNQIGAIKAWETVREQKDITIAIVDTGVDLEHPDLKLNLIEGANLVKPGELPQDDNGHGTSVAGVLAATGGNEIGIAGILWNARIMPIKALDENGDGTEQMLGEAILYAIKNKAKIVVLSVGLHRYSPYMLDIMNYAESEGVLLVAAVGNDGIKHGQKAAVKYPAAYSTVLAVGGVNENHIADSRSNPGPEIDLVAAWNVYTTALGGSYHREEGTSMAAPQAAAAAALVWALQPQLKPYEIRALLRHTAKDIGEAGFDNSTGYGLLQIDHAVQAKLNLGSYEPNNSRATAAVLPLGGQILASLTGSGDQDWYRINAPFDGTITVHYESLPANLDTAAPVRFSNYSGDKLLSNTDTKLASKSFDLAVTKGISYIMLEQSNLASDVDLPYLLSTSFIMKADAFEQNDRSYEATSLSPVTQTITGNFHQQSDRDWFVIHFTQNGKLNLTLNTDTARIDPGLAVQPAGQNLQVYDERGQAETEKSPDITVSPGKYYIRVHNAISADASPVIGTYSLTIEYTPKYEDPNEPNDKMYEALMINPGTNYVGVIGTDTDEDWFQYRIRSTSLVSMTVENVPTNANVKLEGYTKRQKLQFSSSTGSSSKLQTVEHVMEPDVYYAKLTGNQAFDKQYYHFQLKVEELAAGYRDIKGHWALAEISAMSEKGIVGGVGNYRFEPNRAITRAEAVTMLVKAYKPTAVVGRTVSFNDLSAKHWANDAIARAVQQGWVRGFPDGSFKPDQPVTRAEMAVMIGNAKGIKPRLAAVNPFADVKSTNWAAPMLIAMKSGGYINGVGGSFYRPEEKASRAEYAVLLYRVL